MLTNHALANHSTSGNGPEPTTIPRRTLLIGGALAALLSSSGRALAEDNDAREKDGRPNNPFILLLKGIYQPVPEGQGPANNLGLSEVNLNDGSYTRTLIYPIFGVEGSTDQDKSIGSFYVQSAPGNLCAYDLPGGALVMRFDSPPAGAPPGFNAFVPFPDGAGGNYLEGTFELVILEATGRYRDFQDGHNHMVDRLHQLADGTSFDEFCFCIISQYQFP
jgi:hypothetical protein